MILKTKCLVWYFVRQGTTGINFSFFKIFKIFCFIWNQNWCKTFSLVNRNSGIINFMINQVIHCRKVWISNHGKEWKYNGRWGLLLGSDGMGLNQNWNSRSQPSLDGHWSRSSQLCSLVWKVQFWLEEQVKHQI